MLQQHSKSGLSSLRFASEAQCIFLIFKLNYFLSNFSKSLEYSSLSPGMESKRNVSLDLSSEIPNHVDSYEDMRNICSRKTGRQSVWIFQELQWRLVKLYFSQNVSLSYQFRATTIIHLNVFNNLTIWRNLRVCCFQTGSTPQLPAYPACQFAMKGFKSGSFLQFAFNIYAVL